MYGIVANIVIGLLRSLYGLRPGTSGGFSPGYGTTSVTAIQHPDTATSGLIFNAGGNDMTWVWQSLRSITFSNGVGEVIRVPAAGLIGWSNGANSDSSNLDTGLRRVAAGVVGAISSNVPAAGWFQNTSGDRQVTAADVTNVTITPADVTGMTATLQAGRRYRFTLVARVLSATATDGVRFDFGGGTATATLFWANGIITDTLGVRSLQEVTALATDITDTLTTGAALVTIEGHITVDAGGTFIPRFAKEADAAGATATLFIGSSLIVKDMP